MQSSATGHRNLSTLNVANTEQAPLKNNSKQVMKGGRYTVVGKASPTKALAKGLGSTFPGTHCMSLCNTLPLLWTLVSSSVRGKLLIKESLPVKFDEFTEA